jgi:PAS domain S-box-containing protein
VLDYLGISLADLGTDELRTRVFPQDLQRLNEERQRAFARRIPFESEQRIRGKDGKYRWFLVRYRPLSNVEGRVVRWYGGATDIEARKRAEGAHREIEEQWRAAFESNPTMYFIVDAAGTIASVNPFGAEQLGYSVSELVGQSVLSVFHECDRAAVQKHANQCFEQPGRKIRWEARKIRKDGTMLWVRETGNAVVLKKRPVLLVVCEDITEQKRAEDAARRSEKELRDVIDTIPAMAWTTLPDGANDFANQSWLEYVGKSSRDTPGAGWTLSFHAADIDTHVKKWRASLATGKPFENEARIQRARDSEYRWFLHRAVPLRDENDNILKWYGISTDIDDRKRAEALLTGEKRILEMVARRDSLAQILDSLCRFVEEQAGGVLTSILLVDGDRLRLGGAPSLPKAYTNVIDGVAIGPSAGSCGTAAYRGEQVIVEDIATDPLWAEYREAALPHSLRACWSTPVFSSRGKVMATFAMYYPEPRSPSLRDQGIIEQINHLAGVAIERKLTQEALGRSEAYLAEAQRLTHTGSWALRPGMAKPVYWSEEMFRIWGFDPQQGPPANEMAWQRIHPEDLKEIREQIEKTSTGSWKTEIAQDHRIVLPDGAVRYIHGTSHAVCDDAGRIIEYIGTSMDVTERKRAERAARETERRYREQQMELAHANRVATIGHLTASIAHEVNQPIAATVANAEAALNWLSSQPPDLEEVRRALRSIVEDGNRAGDVIDRIRTLIRKKAPARESVVKINDEILEVVALTRGQAVKNGVSVQTHFAEGLPLIQGDRVQLQQVLLNLIVNAVEALSGVSEGARELLISAGKAEAGGVLVAVRDSGPGLPPASLEQVFEAFHTTKPNGLGLGLSICRSIIEAHGGRLWASASAPRGTAFQFIVPAHTGRTAGQKNP